jgi:hypothetical protein
MIQSNKIFLAHAGCWDYGSTDELKYSKNPIFKHFFSMLKSNKNQILRLSMIFKMPHLRIYGRKIISRLFQLVRISKIGFSWNQSFFCYCIINNLNAWRYNSGAMNTKS